MFDGRKVVIEQTLTAIKAQFEGEPEARRITTDDYMHLIRIGVPIGNIL